MKRLALTSASLLLMSTPGFAADLDGAAYRESEVYVERPAAPVVIERRIVERYYYEPELYGPPPRAYAHYRWSDAWYDGSYGYRRPGYYGRPDYWRHRYRHRDW